MAEYTYYIFHFFVLVPVLVLSFAYDVKPHKEIKALLLSYLLVTLPFIIWDIWAASEGHWLFNDRYVLDSRFFGLPIEEIVFFFSVPFATTYSYLALKKYIKDREPLKLKGPTVIGFAGLLAVLAITQMGRAYTVSALLAVIITLVVLWQQRLLARSSFWWFQLVLLGQFLIANTILTALPIIEYGESAIVGFRIGTIPVEDFLFNFAFINLYLSVFLRYTSKK